MKFIAKTLAVAGLATAAMVGVAHADVYSNFMVFNGTGNGSESAALEQATPGTGSIFSTSALYSGTYTGSIDFTEGSGADDSIGTYLLSAGGSFSANSLHPPTAATSLSETLSTGGFLVTTGIEFTFVASANETLTIEHDDGVSLFTGGADVFSGADAAPTSAVDSTTSLLAGKTYTLYYIEANGAPADLIFTTTPVPEPASIALLGAGLFGVGMIRRRKANRNA